MLIGLTGGIGSGKSTVAGIFEAYNVKVFYADRAGIEAYSHGNVKEAVCELLGERAYRPDGRPDRGYIATKVFSNTTLLDGLNGIIHPVVAAMFDQWKSKHDDAEFLIKEAAILFETNGDRHCDVTITVSAPEDLRILRVTARDGVTNDEVIARIRRQMGDDERQARADFQIINDGRAVIPQVLNIFSELRSRRGAQQRSSQP